MQSKTMNRNIHAEGHPISHSRFPAIIGGLSHFSRLSRTSSLRITRLSKICVPFLLFASIGCGPKGEIRSYTIPKETRPKEAAPQEARKAVVETATPSEPTHRMLAAIVPVGAQAWFLKTVGTLAELEAVAPQISTFFEQLSVEADASKPTWTLPEGWTEAAGQGMRAATLSIPSGDTTLEMSVMKLPWREDGPAGMLANVNRWRGQMKLAPVDSESLKGCTKEIGGTTVVDLQGVFDDASLNSGMRGPFAGNAPRSQPAKLPKDHPPISPPAAAVPVAVAGAPKMTVPAGWQPGRLSTFRKAAYNIVDDEKKAEVTVMDFPAGTNSPMADPLGNANRWRGQVGMEPLTKGNLESNSEAIEIAGIKGSFFELLPEGQATGILAAMIQRGDKMWFFKMTGDRELVAGQQANFRSLLKSVQFGDSDGSN